MPQLKGSQRSHLRGLAHDLRPAIQVGKEGLSEAVLDALDGALERSELIKVQLAGERDERRQLTDVVQERLGAECVGQVGRMAIFYRRQPDPEKRRITLPA